MERGVKRGDVWRGWGCEAEKGWKEVTHGEVGESVE